MGRNTLQKSRDKFYKIWTSIRQRCINSNCKDYPRYGGRGIGFLITPKEIENLWIRDKADKMKIPSIDRIDNNGHYVYSNCRFIELSENVKKSHLDRKIKGCVKNPLNP